MRSPGDSVYRIASALEFPHAIHSLDVPVSTNGMEAPDGMKMTICGQHQNSNQFFTIIKTDPPSAQTCKISVSAGEGGTVSGGGTYEEGRSATVRATANKGYTFVSWTENGQVVSTSAAYTFPVTNDRNLTAVFAKQDVTHTIRVSANPSAGGTVSGGGTYKEGDPATIRATPNSGYRFVEWRLNGRRVSGSASYTFTVSEDQTYTAVFEKLAETTGHGTVTVEALFTPYSPAGETVTVRVAPDAGYRASSVRATGPNGQSVPVSGSGNTYTFAMPAFDVNVEVYYVQT